MQEPERPSSSGRAAKLGIRLLIAGGAILAAIGTYQILVLSSSEDASIGVADYRATAVRQSRPAPGFALADLDGGGTISLGEFRGKIVVLNVWASWCLPCRDEAPDLQAAWETYRGRGVQFLGANYRDDRAAAGSFIEEFEITYPSVYDPSGQLASDYGFVGVPTTYVIDRSGRIRFQFTGYLSGPILRDALDELLGEPTR